ncbi:down syndrome cell adhesion molecule-like protein 1 homolog [Striga asiatica]|uniref:Down syndrome cell adhesion molecule-like protein 1 homolog n=1 Tax=Striga asiatica TaxID=4170 RepID=A0A5A7QHW2_STRAF|nr:down syndrome cell adhesion molecule-like protein 1 homolog [Striga asiatica]
MAVPESFSGPNSGPPGGPRVQVEIPDPVISKGLKVCKILNQGTMLKASADSILVAKGLITSSKFCSNGNGGVNVEGPKGLVAMAIMQQNCLNNEGKKNSKTSFELSSSLFEVQPLSVFFPFLP